MSLLFIQHNSSSTHCKLFINIVIAKSAQERVAQVRVTPIETHKIIELY